MKEPMLKKAMDTLEFLSQDPAARMAYDARMKALSDEKSRIESARQVGMAEGMARGEARGRAEAAVKMLEMGMELELIEKIAGMTIKEIKALRPLPQE
uniref:hypothetical protein n=1 Tax=Cohnella fermenti TaxID=2565925 RepID=UPI0026A1C221